jgi:hypothetical protein
MCIFKRLCILGCIIIPCLFLCFLSGCDNQNSGVNPGVVPSESPSDRIQAQDAGKEDHPASHSSIALTISPANPEPARWKKPEKILYVGLLDTERAKDFTVFLKKHFAQVETTPYLEFTDSKSKGFDVTIIDYDGTEFRAPKVNVSNSFSLPMITVGVPGAFVCNHLRLKTGYL